MFNNVVNVSFLFLEICFSWCSLNLCIDICDCGFGFLLDVFEYGGCDSFFVYEGGSGVGLMLISVVIE